MMTDINYTYCDHFAVYTNFVSLYCIPEITMSIIAQFPKNGGK